MLPRYLDNAGEQFYAGLFLDEAGSEVVDIESVVFIRVT